MPRILLSLALIAITGSAVFIGATGAFFSDTETSSANMFTAGAIDLKIDNESYYNGFLNPDTSWDLVDLTIQKFFDFDDVKPADYGEDTISIHVDDNDAYLCASVTLTSDDDNSCTEPELFDDVSCVAPGFGEGDLADLVNFIWWADDGDNVLEDGENVISQGPIGALPIGQPYTLALADVTTNIWNVNNAAGPVPGATTKFIGKAWCFGTLTPQPLPQDNQANAWSPASNNNGNQIAGEPADGGFLCDGSGLNNSSQTDSLTADVTFTAVQSRHNGDFRCLPDEPEIVLCEYVEQFADKVEVVNQGRLKNGGAVLAARSDGTKALFAPQSLGTPYDDTTNPLILNGFFSLGFPSAPWGDSNGSSSIVLSFSNGLIYDGPDEDLKLWEVTGGTSYPDEKVKVEVANSLAGPWTVVAASVTRDAEIDFNGLVTTARYVRITDASDLSLFEATADGFDLDAVQALNCQVVEIGG